MESSTSDIIIPILAAGAAVSVAALTLLQTDKVSRWTLSPSRLMTKRRQEYSYHWTTAVEKAHLQLDYYLAGGRDRFNSDPEINLKNTNFLGSDELQDALLQTILSKTTEARFNVLKIDRDPSDTKGEFYLFLQKQEGNSNDEFFQFPLIPFTQKLAQGFENQLTTTTLCFVADASSGKASGLVEELVIEARTGISVLREPLWMVNVARLAEARVYSNAKLRTMMFALCRLEAWALRDQVKTSHTVMITLPGQSTVAALLPLVQAAFPQDRHVFAYDGCVASVARAMDQISNYRRGALQTQLEMIVSKLAQNPVRHAIPLPSKTPLTKSLITLENALVQLPISQAQVVESWMSSVDAFLKLKDDESKNEYIPYVFKLSFLTNPVGDFAPGTDSFWSLSSLLQFVTGTRSRPVTDGIMDAAREFLMDYNRDNKDTAINFSESESKCIENCVFQHKSILIGNKTLKDSVLPTQHWTLKQASRAGCSCCGPDPYDEQDDDDVEPSVSNNEMKTVGIDTSLPGAFSTGFNKESASSTIQGKKYVDGKMAFAFDPTKFS